MGSGKNKLWIKLLVIAFFVSIFFVLRYLKIDFSQITVESFKETINSLGIWGPIAYIVFYFIRPLILFPAAILSASAGVIWGVKGFIYLQIAANISAIGEFLIARYYNSIIDSPYSKCCLGYSKLRAGVNKG